MKQDGSSTKKILKRFFAWCNRSFKIRELSSETQIIAGFLAIVLILILSNNVGNEATTEYTRDKNTTRNIIYGINCSETKKENEILICLQKASTDANIDVATWTRAQALAGLIGVISFVFTAWAALSSARSANASRESTRIAQVALALEQRPWMYFSHVRPSSIMLSASDLHISIPLVVENLGKSPALDLIVRAIKFDASQVDNYIDYLKSLSQAARQRAREIKSFDAPCFPNVKIEHRLNLSHRFSTEEIETGSKTFGIDYIILVVYRGGSEENFYCTASMYSIWFDKIMTYSHMQFRLHDDSYDVHNLPGANIVL